MNKEFNENLNATVSVYTEPVAETKAEVQPEAVLTQAEDGSWRHAENSPFSPFYVPDRKQKNNNRLTIVLVVVLLFLLVAGLIFAVSKLIEAAVGEAKTAWNESAGAVEEFIADIKEEFTERQNEEPEAESAWSDNQVPDDYEYEYYEPSPDDEYYVELADALRDDLSYSVEFEEYTHSDYDNSVYISVWYAQVSEELANSDTINECLMDSAMYYAYMFESDSDSNLLLEVESFVTYMDEEMLSVVLDEYYYVDGETEYNLYCMNFDLTTGALLNNTEIIEVSDELVEAFAAQSEYQNGYIYEVSECSDEKLKDYMSDEDSLILYYTPVGLEIGFNHEYGWVTATLKDYQRFLKKL